MPKIPSTSATLRDRVFRASTEIQRGRVTREQLRSSAWRRLFHDVYADAAIEVTYRLRCHAVAKLLLPPGAALAGRSAAFLLGAQLCEVDDPIEVLVPPELRMARRAGLVVHTGVVLPGDTQMCGRTVITNGPRTVWDLSQWSTTVDAVIWTDQLLAAEAVTADELVKQVALRRGTRGVSKMEQVVRLADGLAESPQESRLRVELVLGGLPRPVSQYEIRIEGRFVARVDLAWPKYKVAVEYDGVWHAGAGQLHADRKRLNRLVDAGWIVLHVTSVRLSNDLPGIVAEIRSALLKRAAVV